MHFFRYTCFPLSAPPPPPHEYVKTGQVCAFLDALAALWGTCPLIDEYVKTGQGAFPFCVIYK